MSEPGVHRFRDAVPVPWRNGGGVTRQLASSPAGDAFDWRISIADVTGAGDFSAFPGVDRTIVLVDGPELLLTIDGTDQALLRHRPFGFDGGAPVSCSLPTGPTRALNAMTRRGRCQAEVTVRDAAAAWAAQDTLTQLVVALVGPVTVTAPGGRALTLERFDLVVAPPRAGLDLTGTGLVARIDIHA